MFQLSAPYPLLQTTTLLPNPQFSDSESADGRRHSQDGDGRHAVHLRQAEGQPAKAEVDVPAHAATRAWNCGPLSSPTSPRR